MKTIKGFAIHCHHDILLEWCYDFAERVKYIKSDKPEDEQKIRLKLFKMLPKKALKDIPKNYLEAYNAWSEADKDVFHKKWCGCKYWNGKELVF